MSDQDLDGARSCHAACMAEVAQTEPCNCPRDHYRTPNGRCDHPPHWLDDPDQLDRTRYTMCGCCMADCPDVHAEPDPEFRIRPGSSTVAAEYVETLSAEKQRDLRDQESRGELRIVPQREMAIRTPRER